MGGILEPEGSASSEHLCFIQRGKAGVPLLHVCDKTDPWFNDQTKVIERCYKEPGGEIAVIINENDARYPLAVADQTRVVDFVAKPIHDVSTTATSISG